jgi:hypothetical protein
MGRLDFCRISRHSTTSKCRRIFSAWFACLTLSTPIAVHGQISCPQASNQANANCTHACTEPGTGCGELKNQNQTLYKQCLENCEAKCPPPAPYPPSSIVAPYDLTWKTVDLNGLPLNPRWALQDSPTCPGLPSIALCAKPYASPCTTQDPEEWELPHNFTKLFCDSSGVNGHHENWAVVTYTGVAVWYTHSTLSDNDYNLWIAAADESGDTGDNPDRGVLYGVLSEFDAGETINNFVTPWWTGFRNAVNAGNAAAKQMLTVNGKPADIIEVGMMGLDCAHDCGSELHPTYALAVHVKDDPSDDEWAIFARNSGDEGYCSTGQTADYDLMELYITLPWYPGAAGTAPVITDQVWKGNNSFQVTTFPLFGPYNSVQGGKGFVVNFALGAASSGPVVHGEIHLKWDMQTGGTSVQGATIKKVPAPRKIATHGTANSKPEPEEAFAKYVAGLKPDVRKKIEAATAQAHPKPTWTDLHATNLNEAPAGFQAHPPRYNAAGKSALKNIKITPDPVKTSTIEKIDSILREANAPKPPER